MEAIEHNIRKAIRKAKSQGTTGMSMCNLFQVTPTTGVTVQPASYRPMFEDAARKIVASVKFDLIEEIPLHPKANNL